MTKYLLAAEADKIQDLIFRSSRLREVVGGSQLLTRFCREVPCSIDPALERTKKEDVIISAGGSFRILFDTQEAAREFGERLAEVYRLATGGTLTLAEPVKIEEPIDEHFQSAQKKANHHLRRAKRWKTTWQMSEHLPYVAFCASCGIGLAVTHQAIHPDRKAQYACESCLHKGEERPPGQMGKFLAGFYKQVAKRQDLSLSKIRWPGEMVNPETGKREALGDIAEYDSRDYVAYLVADGNDMGKVFDACRTPDEMRTLSKGLTKAVRKALAEPARLLMEQERPKNLSDRDGFVPVYPLILGGDDVFALVPAPWALDFAWRFAQAYEREMGEVTKDLNVPTPTLSVAVVICKSKHPYTLAHEAGESLLKQAKQMSKRWALKNGGQLRSTVNFEVVLGGRLVKPEASTDLRATLRPYWADAQRSNRWGLSVQDLVAQRYALQSVSRKRLAELRDLYDPNNLPPSLRDNDIRPWRERLTWILRRIKQQDEAHFKTVKAALAALGTEREEDYYWRRVSRPPESAWYGHGLPDLLQAWDFTLDLSKPRSKYEEE